jgi:hypothetical protein
MFAFIASPENPDYSAWVSLAFQYGPFFFTLLYLYGVTRWAHQQFVSASTARPIDPKRVATTRWVFAASFVVGVGLTVASVYWWWRYRPQEFVFHGEIRGLRSYEYVNSPKMYRKSEPRPKLGNDPENYRDEHFVILQSSPFKNGQQFELDFWKDGAQAMDQFYLTYGGDQPVYTVTFDEKQGRNTLNSVPEVKRDGALNQLFAEPTVYAQTGATAQVQVDQGRRRISTTGQPAAAQSSATLILQDSHSTVGAKLGVIRDLLKQSSNVNLLDGLPGEPLIITLLDLSRHSDPELAYYASQLLNQTGATQKVVGLLRSSNSEQQRVGMSALLHMDERSSAEVLGSVPSTKAAFEAHPPTWLRLIPTASSQGDQYYVRASWDPKNATVVNCLTDLFNKELISNRPIEQEKKLMQEKNTRLVYWYDKQWSMYISDRITRCGGSASYVSPSRKGMAKY